MAEYTDPNVNASGKQFRNHKFKCPKVCCQLCFRPAKARVLCMVWCVADELPQEEGVQNDQAIAVKVPTASQFDGLASGKGGEGIYNL